MVVLSVCGVRVVSHCERSVIRVVFGAGLLLLLYSLLLQYDTESTNPAPIPSRVPSSLEPATTKATNPPKAVITFHKPVHHFVYHYIHKTASTNTRNQLVYYCAVSHLKCMTDCACVAQCSVESCTRVADKKMLLNHLVGYGDLTMRRITEGGCCPQLPVLIEGGALQGLTIPLPRYVPDNALFIERYFKGAFRFTIVRDPVEEFVSHHAMVHKRRIPQAIPDLATFVEVCYQHIMNGTAIPGHLRRVHWVLTNAQSKALGWHGDMDMAQQTDILGNRSAPATLLYWQQHNITNIMDYVKNLHFVGLTEHLELSWQLLRERLGWPKQFLTKDAVINKSLLPKGVRIFPTPQANKQRSSVGKLKQLNPIMMDKLRTIQWADLQMYNVAKIKFGHFKEEQNNMR